MEKIWLVQNTEDQNRILEAKQTVWELQNISTAPLEDKELVVVGDSAKDKALDLVSRGIDPTRLSYIDIDEKGQWLASIGKPKHLFWDDVIPLNELDITADRFETYPSGIGFLDKDLGWGWRLPELVILAGPYGCGKSTFGQFLAAHFVELMGSDLGGAMLCSWEDLAVEVHQNFTNFSKSRDCPDIMRQVHFVRRTASEDRLVSWYMDLVRYHRKRYGTRFFFLDPWNEMDHQKDARQSETEYIRDIMKELRRLVDEEKIILILATHVPAKFIRGNGEIEPFKIGHSFGSSQFGNKADRGICLVRTKRYDQTNGHAVIRLDKAKVERRMGHRGTIGARFNWDRFEYEKDAYVTSEVKDIWKD